jgi:hypothetical protein
MIADADRVALFAKAAAELLDRVQSVESANRQRQDMEPIGDAAMIGKKKLSTIREQLEKALASSGADPIQRLERRIASAKRKGDRTEVMEGLKRFLESPRMREHRKDGVGARTRVQRGGASG